MEVARILVEHGADAAVKDKDRWTQLHRASKRYDVDLARFLRVVQHDADAAAQDKDGSTPLHRASQRGELVLAWFLIENGADAAAQDNCGWTPLRWASRRGDLDLARLLVEHGANAAAQDEDGWTPLSGASEEGLPSMWAESYPPSGAIAHSLSRYNLPKRGLQAIERDPILLCCQSCGTTSSFLRSLLIDVAQSFISVPREVMRRSCSATGIPGGWKVVVVEFVMHGIDLNKCPRRCGDKQVQGSGEKI